MELPKTAEARIQCIRAAAAQLGGNAALGRALGYRDGAFIGQMLRGERPVTEKTLLAMGRIHQLSTLFGQPHPDQRPAVGGTPTIQVLDEFTVPPLMTWDELMGTTTPAGLIRFAAPDDALPDDAPRGTELIMSTLDLKPQRGDIVLVRDSHGTLYLRRYAEGRGGAWRAVTGRGDGVYLDLDSVADSLVLVAVAEWIKPKRG